MIESLVFLCRDVWEHVHKASKPMHLWYVRTSNKFSLKAYNLHNMHASVHNKHNQMLYANYMDHSKSMIV